MRAREFITERKLAARKGGPLKTTYAFPGMPSANPYAIYRFGMAMANHEISHAEGPTSNSAVIVAYTPEEENIIQAGVRKTGHKGQLVADKESHEPLSTNSSSPIARTKRNKYGV